jgi:hypothetical protein
MTEAKRGRPAMPEAERRQQIGVRTSPALKADLERASGENGRSIAQEAELRLVQSFEQDARAGDTETARLLSMIANDIAAIQRITGKRWHRDLATWAAVSESLCKGAVIAMRPDPITDDEIVSGAWETLWAITQGKERLVEDLRSSGVPVSSNPARRLGMFAGGTADASRAQDFAALDSLAIADGERKRLHGILTGLVLMDQAQGKAQQAFKDALAPYTEAEAKGRAAYHQQAAEQAAKLAAIASATAGGGDGA